MYKWFWSFVICLSGFNLYPQELHPISKYRNLYEDNPIHSINGTFFPDSLKTAALLEPSPAHFALIPSSASDHTNLYVASSVRQKIYIAIEDLGESQVLKLSLDVSEGEHIIPLSLYNISIGWYWVRIDYAHHVVYISLMIER